MGDSYTVGGYDHQSFDCDADGGYLYIAALDDSSLPVLLKLKSDLSEDATEDFAPGAGDFIIVTCGDYNGGVVYASGDFGTSKFVRKNDELGLYWTGTFEDPYWTGDVKPLMVGPGNDFVVMVGVPGEDKLFEAYFDGTTYANMYWTPINEAMPFDFMSIDRLDKDPLQVIIGVDAADPYWYPPLYWYDVVNYAPNGGEAFWDVSGTLETTYNMQNSVTSVTYG
jgi:hypothetical protein